MIPSIFIALDEFPVTPSGKINRKALPEPEQERPELVKEYVAPQTLEEKTLAEVWVKLLHLEKVGIYDNFFDLGGDSILGIQMVAKANLAGIEITARQFYQYPTIAQLSAVAGTDESIQSEQKAVTGPVPFTPIQTWFFQNNMINPHYWNTTMFLEFKQPLDTKLMRQTIGHLLIHHDALRIRYYQDESGWHQENRGVDDEVPFSHIDLENIPRRHHKKTIESVAVELQRSLNLIDGPLLRIIYISLGEGRTNRLFILCHHILLDGVSWRIFMEDFENVYLQLLGNERVNLPPKTSSYRQWAIELQDFANSSKELDDEIDYWLNIKRKKSSHIVPDFPDGDNTYGSLDKLIFSLNPIETKILFQEVSVYYQAGINDILLTALIRAYYKWTGNRTLLVDIEGHGRENILEKVDLSRTIGLFSTNFPVHLNVKAVSNLEEEIQLIREMMQKVPQKGIGYGLLKYLKNDENVRKKMKSLPQAEFNFNYLGQFSATPSSDWVPFKIASESEGPIQDVKNKNDYLLYFTGVVGGETLDIRWLFSRNLFKSATIKTFAKNYVQELRLIIQNVSAKS
jgi:non-ribosomal peptide synthase protein (TIGR01720 family)